MPEEIYPHSMALRMDGRNLVEECAVSHHPLCNQA